MDNLIDRFLGNPTVLAVAGLTFGFWLIGEVSRGKDVQTAAQRVAIDQARALQDLVEQMKRQADEIAALKAALETSPPAPLREEWGENGAGDAGQL